MQEEKPLKMKSVDEIDFSKYQENEGYTNPYYRKFGSKHKSMFSMVSLEE